MEGHIMNRLVHIWQSNSRRLCLEGMEKNQETPFQSQHRARTTGGPNVLICLTKNMPNFDIKPDVRTELWFLLTVAPLLYTESTRADLCLTDLCIHM